MNQMNLAYKAGNYKICGATCATYVDHISIAGWAQIPFCSGGALTTKQYVFGLFINNSTSDATSSATFNATKAELLREQIHAGLASCSNLHLVYLPLTSQVATTVPPSSVMGMPELRICFRSDGGHAIATLVLKNTAPSSGARRGAPHITRHLRSRPYFISATNLASLFSNIVTYFNPAACIASMAASKFAAITSG